MGDTITDITMAGKRDLERGFAACAFGAPDMAMSRVQWFDPKEITDIGVRDFWAALRENYTTENAMGAAMNAAMSANIFNDVVGWALQVPNFTAVEEYANEIKRRNYLISLDKPLGKLLDARRRNNVEDMMAALDVLSQNRPPSNDVLPDAGDAHLIFADIVTSPATQIIKTHIPSIDRAIGGLERKTLAILAARPSVGKSTLAWQIARNVAASGQKALYCSNEMSTANLWSKVACGALGVVWRDVLSGSISPAQKDKLIQVSAEACEKYGSNLIVDDKTNNSVQSIWRRYLQYKPDVIIVDVLAGIKERADSEERRIAAITNGLRELSKETGAAVLALHHINREGESADGRPTMKNLRYSGEIEQSADTVLIMHNPEFYSGKDLAERAPMELWVDKNRMSSRNAKIELVFLTKQQIFEPRNGG